MTKEFDHDVVLSSSSRAVCAINSVTSESILNLFFRNLQSEVIFTTISKAHTKEPHQTGLMFDMMRRHDGNPFVNIQA